MNYQIGEELQWHWRGLKTAYGLDAYKDRLLCDEKADKLGRRLKELVPGCEVGVFRYCGSFEDLMNECLRLFFFHLCLLLVVVRVGCLIVFSFFSVVRCETLHALSLHNM